MFSTDPAGSMKGEPTVPPVQFIAPFTVVVPDPDVLFAVLLSVMAAGMLKGRLMASLPPSTSVPLPFSTVPVLNVRVELFMKVPVAGMLIVPLLVKVLLVWMVPPLFTFTVPLLVKAAVSVVVPLPPVLLNVPLLVNRLLLPV